VRWDDTAYVKLYKCPRWDPWYDVSLEARGLFDELLKVVDRAGLLFVGREPALTIAKAVGGHPDRVPIYLDELLTEGCVVLTEGTDGAKTLVMRNYIEAQTTRSCDAQRKAHSREVARAKALRSTTKTDKQLNLSVAPITQSHPASPGVTPSHDLRREEKRREESGPDGPNSPSAVETTTTETQVYAMNTVIERMNAKMGIKP
jgi:hypothetical protein